jgi:hypothetical protein
MQLVILTFALCLASAYAQAPPTAMLSCSAPSSLPNDAFCYSVVSYSIKNTTNVTINDVTAKNQFNTTYTAINNNSTACQNALTAYYCQQNFPKCGLYQEYTAIATSRCYDVTKACGVTSFPSGYQGTACVANTAITIDGTASVCTPRTVVSLNSTCISASQLVDPSYNGTQALSVCTAVSNCYNSVCVRPSNLGDTCASNSTCVNAVNSIGSQLTCISGTCQYSNKRNGYTCIANGECKSGKCESNKCVELVAGSACTSSDQCALELYCDTTGPNVCTSYAYANTPCGYLTTGGPFVPCVSTFTCVNATIGSTQGLCKSNANLNQTCSAVNNGGLYTGPKCYPLTIPTNGVATCVNSVCTLVTPAQQTEICNATRTCSQDLTCSYSGGSSQGVCTSPASVNCATASPTSSCNTYQTCSCSSVGSTGTCLLDSTNANYACATQKIAISQCLYDSCKNADDSFYPYDTYSCAYKNCLTQINNFFCCAKNAVGSSYIVPNGAPADVCNPTTPTPSPTPTSGASTTAKPTTISPTPTATSSSAIYAPSVIAAAFVMVIALL